VKGGVTVLSNWISGAFEKRQADAFIAVSKAVATGNSLGKTGVPFEIIPNFVPDDVAVPADGDDACLSSLPQAGYILFVGDLNRQKGIPFLLDAYSRLKDAPPLVLIGRPGADLPGELPKGVSVHHSWPHNAVMHAWRRCIFGVAPSVWADPCPTVIMEAMAAGKPVISTTIGGSPDLIDNEQTGLLVQPGDAEALAAAISRLSADPELRKRMSLAALQKIETLKANAVIPRIEKLYERVLSPRPQLSCVEAPNAG
jgi:glycosyltransferase involved in cell wall biosynthesis